MYIWLIQTGEPVPVGDNIKKMRTAILADKLVERGHNVLWWVSAFDHFKKGWIFKKDTELTLKKRLKIIALRGFGYKKNISFARFIDHRVIAMKFKYKAPKISKPDVIVVSTPPYDLAYETVKIAKYYHIPVIVDVRDEWPDIFLNHIPSFMRSLAKHILFKDFKMVRDTFNNATSLVSMMDHLLEWALLKAKREKMNTYKTFYIGAKKLNLSNIKPIERLSYLQEISKTKFVVTFIGTLGQYYNPLILTEIAKKMSGQNVHFIIGGDGIFFNQVNSACKDLKNISLTGWVKEEEIPFMLSVSHVGIIPCPNSITAFPNKAFTYFSGGLPVVSSLNGELKEIIEKYQLGFYYPPNDEDKLIECIIKLSDNPAIYKKMSENVKNVFNEMFDADKIYNEYAEHIINIAYNYSKNQ